MKHKLVHSACFAKTHFGFCRVHVHIHQFRWHFQKQHVGGVTVMVQDVSICLAHRVRKELVAHKTAIHKKILRVAPSTRIRRQTGEAHQPQRPGLLVQYACGFGEVFTHHGECTCLPIAGGIATRNLAVMRKSKRTAWIGQRHAREYIIAMGVLRCRGLQKLAACGCIEKQVSNFHHGADRKCCWLGTGYATIQRTQFPRMRCILSATGQR